MIDQELSFIVYQVINGNKVHALFSLGQQQLSLVQRIIVMIMVVYVIPTHITNKENINLSCLEIKSTSIETKMFWKSSIIMSFTCIKDDEKFFSSDYFWLISLIFWSKMIKTQFHRWKYSRSSLKWNEKQQISFFRMIVIRLQSLLFFLDFWSFTWMNSINYG